MFTCYLFNWIVEELISFISLSATTEPNKYFLDVETLDKPQTCLVHSSLKLCSCPCLAEPCPSTLPWLCHPTQCLCPVYALITDRGKCSLSFHARLSLVSPGPWDFCKLPFQSSLQPAPLFSTCPASSRVSYTQETANYISPTMPDCRTVSLSHRLWMGSQLGT